MALKTLNKFSVLLRDAIRLWEELKFSTPVLLLHLGDVDAKPVFPSDLKALREMVDFLVFIKSII
jgi:hypothetical protein